MLSSICCSSASMATSELLTVQSPAAAAVSPNMPVRHAPRATAAASPSPSTRRGESERRGITQTLLNRAPPKTDHRGAKGFRTYIGQRVYDLTPRVVPLPSRQHCLDEMTGRIDDAIADTEDGRDAGTHAEAAAPTP